MYRVAEWRKSNSPITEVAELWDGRRYIASLTVSLSGIMIQIKVEYVESPRKPLREMAEMRGGGITELEDGNREKKAGSGISCR
jgi:hypothetical protein